MSLVDHTDSTEPSEHSGAILLTVNPSLYLRRLDLSDAKGFATRFLTGDMGLIQSSRQQNWDIANISSQLSTDEVIRKIRVRVGREFADKVKFGNKLGPNFALDHDGFVLPHYFQYFQFRCFQLFKRLRQFFGGLD